MQNSRNSITGTQRKRSYVDWLNLRNNENNLEGGIICKTGVKVWHSVENDTDTDKLTDDMNDLTLPALIPDKEKKFS